MGATTNSKTIAAINKPNWQFVFISTIGALYITIIPNLFSWGKHYVSHSTKFALVSHASRSDSIHLEKLNLLSHIFIHLSYIVMTRCIESLRVAILVFNVILI